MMPIRVGSSVRLWPMYRERVYPSEGWYQIQWSVEKSLELTLIDSCSGYVDALNGP